MSVNIETFITPFGAEPREGQAPLEVQFIDAYPFSLIIENSDETIFDAELIELANNAGLYGEQIVIEERSV